MWHLRTKLACVYSDPTSMASVFAMSGTSVLEEIRSIDDGANVNHLISSDLKANLKVLDLHLQHSKDQDCGATRYQVRYQIVVDDSNRTSGRGHRKNLPGVWLKRFCSSNILILFITLIAIAAFVTLDRFLGYAGGSVDYGTSLGRWRVALTITIAVFVKMCWTTIERDKIQLTQKLSTG
jgi:hypothetical protein